MKRTYLMIGALGLFFVVQAASAGWTPAKRLSWTSATSQEPDIVADSAGNVHVVWTDFTATDGDIYYTKSTNGGASWAASKRLTWTPGVSQGADMVLDSSGNLHMVWWDRITGGGGIYYKRSTNGGTTWSAGKRLTWTSGWSEYPTIAVDHYGNVHVVWSNPVNAEIYCLNSTDGGYTWSAAQRLTWTSISSVYPVIIVDFYGNCHLVWDEYIPADGEPGSGQIYFKQSWNYGTTWTTSKRLTWTANESQSPIITVDSSGTLHLVWYYYCTPENAEIYYRKSTNGGTSWSAPKRLTWMSGLSMNPAIVVDSADNPHVIWEDEMSGNLDIYYKKSTDGGATWTSAERLTWTSSWSADPAIAVGAFDSLHVVWYDLSPDGEDIYYRRTN
jgi:hypothetical protein